MKTTIIPQVKIKKEKLKKKRYCFTKKVLFPMFIDIIHDEPVISETSKQTRKNEKTKSETTCRLSLIT